MYCILTRRVGNNVYGVFHYSDSRPAICAWKDHVDKLMDKFIDDDLTVTVEMDFGETVYKTFDDFIKVHKRYQDVTVVPIYYFVRSELLNDECLQAWKDLDGTGGMVQHRSKRQA